MGSAITSRSPSRIQSSGPHGARTGRACPRGTRPQDRVQEPAVHVAVHAQPRRGRRRGIFPADRIGARFSVMPARCRSPAARSACTAEPVREQDVVAHAQRASASSAGRAPWSRGRGPWNATHPGLVDRDPLRHHVAERVRHRPRVLGEALRGVAGRPAAAILERLRQVPVVEGRDRLDPALDAGPRQAAGRSRSPAWLTAPSPVRQDARPGDREAVATRCRATRIRSQVDAPAVVVVAGHVAVVAVARRARACAQKRSQIDSPRPSSRAAPSIW